MVQTSLQFHSTQKPNRTPEKSVQVYGFLPAEGQCRHGRMESHAEASGADEPLTMTNRAASQAAAQARLTDRTGFKVRSTGKQILATSHG